MAVFPSAVFGDHVNIYDISRAVLHCNQLQWPMRM
jgi:hypothetical protein